MTAQHLPGARRPMPDALSPHDGPVLVVGMGVTGCAVATALRARGHEIIVADDRPDAAAARVASAGLASVEIHDSTDRGLLSALVSNAAAVVPSPGVPPRHPCYTLADAGRVPVVSELDLAAQWDNRPLAAITGTNGKTTVTVLTERMLNRSGISALGAGNTDVALVDAIDRDVTTFVVEASSFRLHRAQRFAPAVAAWLNLAPDHLDWHVDLRDYAASKARIWAAQGPHDVAVVPFDDPDVEPWTSGIRSRRVTFATPQSLDAACDVRYEHGVLMARHTALVATAELPRRRPHDLSNAAAAAAIALEMGASAEAVAAELRSFDGLPHRLALAGRIGDVSFHDDSKATAPHATVAALRGFSDAVLIAGGRNKGLDLDDLAAVAAHVRGVIAIGEAASDVIACFSRPAYGQIELSGAGSMSEAVEIAYRMAQPTGDVVLSPGCASFDWYSSYRERGEHFIAAVSDLASRLGPQTCSGDLR
ncbi:UDP-N-acetylmuramoyl-L-alanine--D-glutamate ligase [Candidatus Poriferisodalis sp.]|uniref:UDP-N-acetylmuramoyl-L-alanine--D-glutamate ligase n=1 Tax=Candidatus Poriferisodalis sp. TaxID=3101277 RepID=UPI003B529661